MFRTNQVLSDHPGPPRDRPSPSLETPTTSGSRLSSLPACSSSIGCVLPCFSGCLSTPYTLTPIDGSFSCLSVRKGSIKHGSCCKLQNTPMRLLALRCRSKKSHNHAPLSTLMVKSSCRREHCLIPTSRLSPTILCIVLPSKAGQCLREALSTFLCSTTLQCLHCRSFDLVTPSFVLVHSFVTCAAASPLPIRPYLLLELRQFENRSFKQSQHYTPRVYTIFSTNNPRRQRKRSELLQHHQLSCLFDPIKHIFFRRTKYRHLQTLPLSPTSCLYRSSLSATPSLGCLLRLLLPPRIAGLNR